MEVDSEHETDRVWPLGVVSDSHISTIPLFCVPLALFGLEIG